MNCPKCGNGIEAGSKFCGICGAPAPSEAGSQTTGGEQAAPAQQAPARVWLIHVGGQNHGPYSTQELTGYIKAGRVHPQTHTWKEGMSGWKPASEIPELSGGAAPAQKQQAPPARKQAVKKAAAAVPVEEEEVQIDRKAAKKYGRQRSKREKKEQIEDAKKRGRDKVEQRLSVKAMKTREGKEIQFYEGTLFVLLFMVILPPVGIVLLFLSRKVSAFGKLGLIFFFGLIWGAFVFFKMNPNLVPGAELDQAAIASLPTGINEASFNAIRPFMQTKYVITMLDEPVELKKDERPIIGDLDVYIWIEKQEQKRINISIWTKEIMGKNVVIMKDYNPEML